MRRGFAALAAASVLVLAGCTPDDGLAEQYREGSGKNYIAGDGTVQEWAAGNRDEPVVFEGVTVDGDAFDSTALDGEVLVVNFWYASCAPCRAEAPILQSVSEDFAGAGASVVGVNVRDQAATAASFEGDYGLDYPSIIDIDSGSAQLAFAGSVRPNAVPTTIVLDAEHRVAARILGQLPEGSVLQTIVGDLVEEAGGAGEQG
ncbi:TlpA family protein disulfide reductase [Agromyces archimandritae]|uniref:TlpA family protein disulfide reductase n=1 Tax=Agromyces archimandritae TaxID=2781962 RepID=A0A975FJF0_9MICO|nr:TlpA disulfide reductase family protein [Agromyces archimandritae]QTX03615.1 TlpA family protein disulfide reductase [Agromyces archimandritae]